MNNSIISRRTVIGGGAALAGLAAAPRRAKAAAPIRIGVLTDLSGTYSRWAGATSVACVRQAVADMAGATGGFDVDVIQGDHLNKADAALALARRWFDEGGVDAICDVNNSAIALGLAGLCQEKNKVFLAAGPASAKLTGENCSPNIVHWTYDTWMLSKSTGTATVRAGGDTWFFITADYAFGDQMEHDTTRFIEAAGGKIAGHVRFPFPGTTDFASYLLQAQSSGAKVVGLATAGNDTVNLLKQAQEFGMTERGTKLAGMIVFITDVHAVGLPVAQGLLMTEVFYWDLNDRTRSFLQRVRSRTPDNYPNSEHAGCYSATMHYLKAVAALGAPQAQRSGLDTVNRMKAMPTDDDCFGPGRVRADGRKIHPAYLFEVKRPAESRGPWDYLKLINSTPADEAFRPQADGNCPMLRG